LESLTWFCGMLTPDRRAEEDICAVVNFMRNCQSHSIVMKFRCLRFTEKSADVMRRGIIDAKVRGFVFRFYSFGGNGGAWADALTQPRFQVLRLPVFRLRHSNESSSASSFFQTLTQRLSRMSQLRDLEIGLCCIGPDGEYIGLASCAMADIVNAAGHCRHLESLKISCRPCCNFLHFDKELADIIRNNQQLKTIECTFRGSPAFPLDAFAKALQTNYTLEHATFREWDIPGSEDVLTTKMVTVVCRLNRSGRSYVKTDPNDAAQGINVLEAVLDDLDCIYFHLRENPALCGLFCTGMKLASSPAQGAGPY
jgi:hypothetical protein